MAGPWVRLSVRVRAHALDRALSEGADPAASRQLAARAAMLTTPRFRDAIAGDLEHFLCAAAGPAGRMHVRPQPAAVLDNAPGLRALAALLRGGSPVYARGIASVARLLGDGTGPAYTGDSQSLGRRIGDARAALAGNDGWKAWLYRRHESS